MSRNLKFLFLIEGFAGLSRGSFLVCIGWTTLMISDDVAKVGQVFIIAMLTNLLAGPVLGVLVDRYDRKTLAIIAHCLIAVTLAAMAAALTFGNNASVLGIGLVVVVVSLARLMYHLSHDGLIHANVETADLGRRIAQFRTMHLLAVALGTMVAGLVIEQSSPAMSFGFSSLMSVMLIAPLIGVASAGPTAKRAGGIAGFKSDFLGGLALAMTNKAIRNLAILAAIALPVGQLSNAIMPGFIREDLGFGGDIFGLVDSGWPIGGMLAALTLSFGFRSLARNNLEYVFSALAGLATVVLSITASIAFLLVLHALMGYFVWLCRITIDARVLTACRTENVGRSKVIIEMTFSLSALIMCISPTLIKLENASGYFTAWGLFIVCGSALAFLLRRKQSDFSS
ncbi:MAG: DHA3 family macrolide efflux protein-like MFS transporter [Paracoccaceae bacterium]|jgi:DHA3 family macrolide efflux protein-like MFS transporter